MKTMTTILSFVLLGLFGLKILWNFLTPYLMAWRLHQTGAEKSSGVTILPFVEVGLLVLAILVSFVAGASNRPFHPKEVAIWGVVAIVLSYVHFIVGGFFAGWFLSLLRFESRCKVKFLGRAGMIYSEGGKRMEINSELMPSPHNGVFIYLASIEKWQRPHDEFPVSEGDKLRIKANLTKKLKGYQIEWL